MQAEIITIGDEILIGQIIDTNSAYIAQALNKIGVSVYQITSIQDDKTHILKALKEAEGNADIIIITGGLGPTKDDITKHTLAEYFNDTLELDEAVLKHVQGIFAKYSANPISQLNVNQALVPSMASVLHNEYGTAPGMWIESDNKVFVSLPGVPFEMKGLIDSDVIPRIQKKYKCPFIMHKTYMTYGLGESALAERIEAWEDALPKEIKLAYLPNIGKVRLRLSAKGLDKAAIITEMDRQEQLLMPQIKDVFVGIEGFEDTMEEQIGKTLTVLGQSVSTAESCTGGRIAEQFTSHPGASEYFKGSVVSYATQAKIDVLNIPEALILEHSVVSSEVAEAMAKSALKMFNSDYAIATTGNAGPSKATDKEELGTVFIAIASKTGVYSEKFNLGNLRIKVVNKAVDKALGMLQKEILKNRC
ncbi:CinA family nicotinamide mononucleotide deamidase-related protein [Formosa sp. PL04]|uniref:CinA family nicotinamide mononucleotide deamidase-related protein n=1 Tax=Formosa sp. PL04 TaxID=3081755 RepID=UPI0029811D9F|nr:CinA family nicotinamide mononucleotide deamidase-related protein [Formosa sp. PL04]MDW5290086.1 CinA family nicotinamide mononucleotide deamidase-related protein [Formosa sp. PL04]